MSSATRATEAPARRLSWRTATVGAVRAESPRARTLRLDLPRWPGHRAGQHVDLRLTAEDGYQAQRAYSIASAPEQADAIELCVERLDDGEVSPYLVDAVEPGDQLEVRGPIGGYFAWDATNGSSLFLVGGGSGVVPLVAMLRHRAAAGTGTPASLLVSARTLDDVLFRRELDQLGADVHVTLTRERPPTGWAGSARRVDAQMLAEVAPAAGRPTECFACGPSAFVELVAQELIRLGYPPANVKTERFGPSGG